MALPRLLQENGSALLEESGGYILLDGVSGSGASTQGAATSSGTGAETFTGTGTSAQAAPTSAGSGGEVISGSGSATQAGATSTAPTAQELFTGAGASVVQAPATGTGSGRTIDAGDAADDLVLEGEDLLPDNATQIEQQVAITWRALQQIDPTPIATLWNAWNCPAPLLPFLAWSLSVNIWNDTWDETTKRQAIADSIPFHLVKGSRGSVERALATMNKAYSLTEWWETVPAGAPGTARVFIELGPTDDLLAMRQEAKRLVLNSKPKSRYVYAGVGSSAPGTLSISMATGVSSTLTVQPYTVEMPEVDSGLYVGAAAFVSSVLTVGP